MNLTINWKKIWCNEVQSIVVIATIVVGLFASAFLVAEKNNSTQHRTTSVEQPASSTEALLTDFAAKPEVTTMNKCLITLGVLFVVMLCVMLPFYSITKLNVAEALRK